MRKGDLHLDIGRCKALHPLIHGQDQREDDKENLVKAKNILLEGIEKFPKNERILDGLMSL